MDVVKMEKFLQSPVNWLQKERMNLLHLILFRTSKNVYQYEMSLTKKEIISEKLTMFLPKKRILYNRNTEEIYIHASVNNQHIQYIFKNSQKNTTILNEIYKKKQILSQTPTNCLKIILNLLM